MECTGGPEAKHCSCTYTACSRWGHCCQCVTHHQRQGEIPGCFFSREGEVRCDRSLAAFLCDRGGRL